MSAILNTLMSIARNSGFVGLAQEPGYLAMIVVACILLYLAIVKEFEPLLLLPIAFGMLLANLPFILIQRYNRPRLVRLAALLQKREQRKGKHESSDTEL